MRWRILAAALVITSGCGTDNDDAPQDSTHAGTSTATAMVPGSATGGMPDPITGTMTASSTESDPDSTGSAPASTGSTATTGATGEPSPTVEFEDLFEEGPIGFGQDATGGRGGSVCIVTSLAGMGPGTLRECATRDEPTWVRFEARGEIVLEKAIDVSADLTIDGRDGDPIVLTGPGRLLHISVANVIVTNLAFVGSGTPDGPCIDCGDPVMIRTEGAYAIWIDHCLFETCGDECLDVWNGATDVTVSWSRWQDSYYAMLLGWSQEFKIRDLEASTARVTVHHNYFSRVKRRSPRAATAQVHAFNNFVRAWGNDVNGYGAASVREAEVLLEHNIFLAPGSNKHASIYYSLGGSNQPEGFIRAVDNQVLSGAIIEVSQEGSVFDPADSYPYAAEVADRALEDKLRSDAGLR